MATSRFCWGAHDPPTPKSLRTLATHIVAYPWDATLPLRDWGNTVLSRWPGEAPTGGGVRGE